jgi:hypothetical protein
VGAGVAAVSRTFDSMDVFYVGTDGGLRDVRFVAGSGWSTTPVGVNDPVGVAGGFVTAVARDSNDMDAFFIGKTGAVYQAHYATNGYAAGWSAPVAIPGASGTPGNAITAVSRAEAIVDLAWVNAEQIDIAEGSGAGSAAPLTWSAPLAITGATQVSGAAAISLAARDSADLALYYTNVVGEQYAASWVQNEALATWQIVSPALAPCPFALSLGSSSLSFDVGTNTNGETTISATGTAGQTLDLSVTGLPAGVTPTFGSSTLATGGSTWLELVAAPGTALQSFSATIVATEGALSNSVVLPVTLGACVPTVVNCSTSCGTISNGCGGEVVCKACGGKTCECGGVYPKCDICQ